MNIRNPLARAPTIESLTRDEAIALKNAAAQEAERSEKEAMALALTEAGATDEQIDAAERAAKLAKRAAARFKAEAESAARQRRELAAAIQARIEDEHEKTLASLLDQHIPNARAVARSAYKIHAQQARMSAAGMHRQLAKVPPLPPTVYDGSGMNAASPRISEEHPLLDAFENEVARFKAGLK